MGQKRSFERNGTTGRSGRRPVAQAFQVAGRYIPYSRHPPSEVPLSTGLLPFTRTRWRSRPRPLLPVASPHQNDRCRAGCRRLGSTPPNGRFRQQRKTAADPMLPVEPSAVQGRDPSGAGARRAYSRTAGRPFWPFTFFKKATHRLKVRSGALSDSTMSYFPQGLWFHSCGVFQTKNYPAFLFLE